MGVVAAASVPVLELTDEIVGVGATRCCLHFGIACTWPAIADVVADRAMQQGSVLRHHRNGGAQALLRNGGNVLAVDEDPALLWLIEVQQQVNEGRLAGARSSD